MKSITVESIENFIFEGRIEAALDYMLLAAKDLVDNQQLYHDLMQLKSRYSTNEDKMGKEIIAAADYQLERAKILHEMIECKEEVAGELGKQASEALHNVELELLIYTNAYAYTIGDAEMIRKTMHSGMQDEMLAQYLQAIQQNNLDLEYEVESIEIIEIGEEFATANVTQVTKDKNPSFFRNNRTKMSHTFLKENGRWKFYYSIPQEITYL